MTTMPSCTDSFALTVHALRVRPSRRSKPSSSSFSLEAVRLAPRVRPLAGAHPTGTASLGGARVHRPGTASSPRMPGTVTLKPQGPSPLLFQSVLCSMGALGGAPPRVRFWLLQDLLTPRPQTYVGLCDAPRKRKIQASTLCCPRAPRTWPSWNLRPGEKVAQLRSEGSPSPGHAKQKGASLAGLGAPVAWAGCFLLHSDPVLRRLPLHSDPVLRRLLLHPDLVLRV